MTKYSQTQQGFQVIGCGTIPKGDTVFKEISVMLEETFIGLVTNYTDDKKLTGELWSEIQKSYSHKKRHYHTLQHLEYLLIQLKELKAEIQNWEAALFSLYYHDIIYDALKTNNEEKSAGLAEKRMIQICVPFKPISLCKEHILATKAHLQSVNSDTNYFTDADLSVLGQTWENYSLYFQSIRKEYSFYPDFIYTPGRKKVLNHFLNMDRIFKTNFFYSKFETTARQNIKKELQSLK